MDARGAVNDRVVVVGIDGSEASVDVLEFALREGLRRGVAVEVVTAVGFELPAPGYGGGPTYAETKQLAQRTQDALVRRALGRMDSAPPISQVVVEGRGADALVHAARRAEVLVVGHHHRRFLVRATLGSVAEGCLRRAQIPILVVPVGVPAHEDQDKAELAATGPGPSDERGAP